MTASGKLRVFAPQIIGTTVSTGLWTAFAMHLPLPVCVFLALAGSITGAVAVLTALFKADYIDDHGWNSAAHGGCDACMGHEAQIESNERVHTRALEAITKDRDELRQAIAIMEVPQ